VTAAKAVAGAVELGYEESGSGPAVLLVHGTATGRGLWREVVATLGERFRAIAFDRRAYGDSGAPEPYEATTVEEQAQDAAALVEALGARPAVVCGHDLGAVVCLDLLRRHGALTVGAVLIEPPLHSLAVAGAETVGALREAIERGVHERGPAGAVDAFLVETAGPAALERLGAGRVEAARASTRGFAAELGAAATWDFGRRDLRALEAPVVVLTGSRSALPWGEMAAALAEMLPSARLETVDAGHLAPIEAPAAVAAAIREVADV
jgi:pimeloyl-ACP methyl ester carboxylesterase